MCPLLSASPPFAEVLFVFSLSFLGLQLVNVRCFLSRALQGWSCNFPSAGTGAALLQSTSLCTNTSCFTSSFGANKVAALLLLELNGSLRLEKETN